MTTFNAQPGVENLIGGAGDDQFVIPIGAFDAGDSFTGGGGFDSIILQANAGLYLGTIYSIEALRYTNPADDHNNLQITYVYDGQFGAGFSNALTVYAPEHGSYSMQVGVSGASFSAANWVRDAAGSGNFNLVLLAWSSANTTLTGATWAQNTLLGNAGNDTLIGGDFADVFADQYGGTNTFSGGKGDDRYSVYRNSDSIIELAGEGTDTVATIDLPDYTLPANFENLQVNFSVVYYDNFLGIGNDLNNRFDGAGRNARFYGLLGDDVFDGYGVNTFFGGEGADTFYGQGDNTFVGGQGADRFTAADSTSANNVVSDFNAGEGDKIDLVASNWRTFYDILGATSDVSGGAIIQIDADSSIKLQGVSRAQLKPSDFSLNSMLPSLQVPKDFTRDNVADVLWGKIAGELSLWSMQANGIESVSSRYPFASGFTAIDNGHDFNGDGASDLLIRNPTTGAVQINMDVFWTDLPAIDLSWRAQGVGDFNGDRNSDVLWRHSNGDVSIWTMNETTLTDSVAMPKVDNNWKIQGLGDFNGDGKTDVLWRHLSGQIVFWQMDGATIKDNQALNAQVDLSWHVAGLGDFDGDGKSDIVWRHNTGFVSLWTMDGYNIASNTAIADVDNLWKLEAIGDYTGDGSSDLLWRNNGFVAMWQMNGSQIDANVGIGSIAHEWSIVGGNPLAGEIV